MVHSERAVIAEHPLRSDEAVVVQKWEPGTERRQPPKEWNGPRVAYPPQCFHALFEQQVQRTPDAIAVACGDETLTYVQLDRKANQLAHWLQGRGVGPDVLVGLYVERSPEMLVGLLGILKAGGTYLPLDPAYPPERLAFMLQDSRTPLLLTQQALSDRLPGLPERRLCLDSDWETVRSASEDAPRSAVGLQHLAYVIYTSGSTGIPKGVMISHGALTNYACWAVEAYALAEGSGCPIHSSLAFDLTVTGLFPPLLAGKTVSLLRQEEALSALGSALVQSPDFSLVKITPAHLELLQAQVPTQAAARATRRFVIGGEALLGESLAFWRKHAPATRIINEYGPTETTVGCCVYALAAGDCPDSMLPIGRPIANTQLYVLDTQRAPVPIGEPGELYIGGTGLARGYLNRADLTAERFVPNPFSAEPGARLYRTGDLVKYLPDGNLEFLGRLDHQVKIRGFRIELGEVECALRGFESVQEAVVLAREDTPGQKRLTAYVTAHGEQPTAAQLRSFLKERLPEYMLPEAWVWLDTLPLTENGKLDRKALPAPGKERSDAKTEYVAPRDPIEAQLCPLWEEALGIRPIGVTDNFLELGGESLIAAKLFARLKEVFHRELPISTLVSAPTIAQLAALLRIADPDAPASSLVPMKPSGARRPFFCVHGAGANVLHMSLFTQYMAPEQPLYGLQAQGLDEKREPFTTIQEMAAHYITEIRTVQPSGPYMLGGLSFGGLVAFEMAQQLVQAGDTVGLVALLDTNFPTRKRLLPNHIWRFQRHIYPNIEAIERQWMERNRLGLRAYLRARWTAWKKGLRRYRDKETRGLPEEWAEILPIMRKVWRTNLNAGKAYEPVFYPGKITLFHATDWSLTQILLLPDMRLKWCEVAGGGLEVHTIPGNHDTIRYEPFVGVMIRKLNLCLEQAHQAIDGNAVQRDRVL